MINNTNKILNLIGIAQRAGAVITGENLVLTKIRQKKLSFVFLAIDTGQATAKKITDKCSTYSIPISKRFNKDQLSHAIGKNRTIIGIQDSGFGKQFVKLSNLKKGE